MFSEWRCRTVFCRNSVSFLNVAVLISVRAGACLRFRSAQLGSCRSVEEPACVEAEGLPCILLARVSLGLARGGSRLRLLAAGCEHEARVGTKEGTGACGWLH